MKLLEDQSRLVPFEESEHDSMRPVIEPVLIAVPAEESYSFSMSVPRTSKRHSPKIVEHQLSHRLPISLEKVIFQYHLLGSRRAETFDLFVTAVDRDFVDRCLRTAAQSQILVEGFLANPSANQTIFFIGSRPKRTSRISFLGFLFIFSLIGVISILCLIYLHTLSLERVNVSLADSINSLHEDALATSTLLNSITHDARDFRIRTTVIDVLSMLSSLLPDDTWLSEIDISDNVVLMSGYTAQSEKLIPLLLSGDIFKEAQFVSPLTREAGGNLDRFSMKIAISDAD